MTTDTTGPAGQPPALPAAAVRDAGEVLWVEVQPPYVVKPAGGPVNDDAARLNREVVERTLLAALPTLTAAWREQTADQLARLCHWVQGRRSRPDELHEDFHFGFHCPYLAMAAVVRGHPDPRATPARTAAPVPVQVASIGLDELSDWELLAEAMGAELRNQPIGDTGDYAGEMHWPDGRVAYERDRLVILSADSELDVELLERCAGTAEAEYQAERAVRDLENLDPAAPGVVVDRDRADMRRIGAALYGVEDAEAALAAAVGQARDRGRSWTEIATVLGVPRWVARQRFGGEAENPPDGVAPDTEQG